MIDKSFIEKIEQLSEAKIIEQDGLPYATRAINLVQPPMQKQIEVETLTGLRDYVVKNPDAISAGNSLIHVVAPDHVRVLSAVDPKFKTRTCYLVAGCKHERFEFGDRIDLETFIIALQSQFVQDEATALLLKTVGNIADGNVTDWADDGVSQKITQKAGIDRRAEARVPNPVSLRPYRTFIEVEQPASKFVLRMRSGGGGSMPTAALHNADGGAWKREAIENVRKWLAAECPTMNVLA